MKRREFMAMLGGAAAWPISARAQQSGGMPHIAVLTPFAQDDPEGQDRLGEFQKRLEQLGWTDRRNVLIEYRWAAGDAERLRRSAAELVALRPNVLVATGGTSVGALLQATRAVPIVFANVPDPVGSGFVEGLARPGGNATGFMQLDYGLSGKWVQLLKEVAPNVTRVAVIRDTGLPFGIGQFAVIQSVAPTLGVEVSPINIHDPDIERSVGAFARSSNGGLVVASSGSATVRRDLLVALAERHKLPTVYPSRSFVSAGGLISYAPDVADQFRGAAEYVDRILKGEKPADMPVQGPTRYVLAVNLKAAAAIGLTLPPTLLARADEVIE